MASVGRRFRHILIVDDEEAFLNTLKRHLKREGFVLSVAANGNEAYRVIDHAFREPQTPPIDLVITDMVMPLMGGIELLKHIKNDFPDISTILLTGFGDTDSVQSVLRPGKDAFCQKPITPDELMSAINTLDVGSRYRNPSANRGGEQQRRGGEDSARIPTPNNAQRGAT